MLNFDIELSLKKPVIGIDEVGRGPLAGPVVSCACIFLDYLIDQSKLFFFDDSKKLTSKKREEAFQIVHQLKNDNKLKYALGLATVNEIDSLNILEATKISMKRAVQKLQYDKANLIIDGKIDLELPEFPSIGIVNGDQLSFSIATASIIAKASTEISAWTARINLPLLGDSDLQSELTEKIQALVTSCDSLARSIDEACRAV